MGKKEWKKNKSYAFRHAFLPCILTVKAHSYEEALGKVWIMVDNIQEWSLLYEH